MRAKVALGHNELFRCTMRSTVTNCFSFNCLDVNTLTYSRIVTVDELPLDFRNIPYKMVAWRKSVFLSFVLGPTRAQTVRRLPPPFASKCTDYKARGIKKEFMGYLTQDLCVQECMIKQEGKTCGCVRPQHEYGSQFEFPTCTFQTTVICDKQITNKTLTKCMKKCGAPCEETSYDVRLTSLGEDRKEKGRISFSVSVKFSSDSQKIFEYQPKLTVIEAFGYMGGYIGMWLGLSLYSLITDGELWLRKFFTKRALKSSAEK
ncbi:unnamed protein product [Ixodes pacificus]